MRLSSPIYTNYPRYAVVYHTQLNSDEVEFVRLKFFKSEKKAWEWFTRKFKVEDFVQPQVVLCSNLQSLYLHPTSISDM